MNTEVILKMVEPYLKDNKLAFGNFIKLFSFLSRQEQYGVIDILIENNIDFIDKNGKVFDYYGTQEDSGKNNSDIQDGVDNEEEIDLDIPDLDDEFEILYDEDIFKDKKITNPDDTMVYKDIKQSNDILCRLLQEGNMQAKQDLCVKNKRLVDKYAGAYEKYYGNHLSFDDIEQAGMIGLIKAGERFDYTKGYQFSTYAVWWIRQSIVREIFDNGFAIRVPVHMMEKIAKITRLDNRYAGKEMEYEQRIAAIADEIGTPPEYVEYGLMIRQNYLSYSSLDVPVGEDESTELLELIKDDEAISVENEVSYIFLREQLDTVIETLTDREQKILRLRFGLDDGRARTLEEIGQEFNVTRERIRQIEAKALRKLRHPSRSRKLKDFLD